jgi:hypothetical protein
MKKVLFIVLLILGLAIFSKLEFSKLVDERNIPQSSLDLDKSYLTSRRKNIPTKKEGTKELKAFPSAEGAGAYTTGGRRGKVFVVNNLNDSGKGSFREAVEALIPRIIVFSISGIIHNATPLTIHYGNLTIAGQTAPKGGITISGKKFVIDGADNTIIRYLKIRPKWSNNDALQVLNTSHFIADHLSVSFGGDEAFTVRGGKEKSEFVTVQRTLFANSKTGSIQGDSDNFDFADNFSFHHNLFYNITHRFPNIGGNGRFEIINNVVHNWMYRLIRGNGSFTLNHINNYYQSSVLSNQNIKILLNKYGYDNGSKPNIYTIGNLIMPYTHTNPNSDNWYMWQWFLNIDEGPYNGAKKDTPLTIDFRSLKCFPALGSPITIQTAKDAFEIVINDVGANARIDEYGIVVANIDSLDSQCLFNVKENINTRYNGKAAYDDTVFSVISEISDLDSDRDGMPDVWEISNDYNPNIDDSFADLDNDGYTNIEEYLNSIDYN